MPLEQSFNFTITNGFSIKTYTKCDIRLQFNSASFIKQKLNKFRRRKAVASNCKEWSADHDGPLLSYNVKKMRRNHPIARRKAYI